MNGTGKAGELRRRATDAEGKLWSKLRGRQIDGHKFRRQVPIGNYIADFVCFERRLVVEVDGGQHQARIEYDDRRTKWLQSAGFRVIRFWDNEVLCEMDGVLEGILMALAAGDSPSP